MNHNEEEQEFFDPFAVGSFHDSFDSDTEELNDFDADATGFEEPMASDTVDTVNTVSTKRKKKRKKKASPPSLERKVKKKAIHSSAANAKKDSIRSRPKRALSAYNLFFQHERKQMIKVGFSDMAVSDDIVIF
jgi:hypothetical protein